MFRACLAQTSRNSASPSTSSLIHTSAVLNASKTQKLTSKAKAEIKAEKWQRTNANRPSPVFGTRKGEEAPPNLTPIKLPVGTVNLPSQMGFGVTDTDAEKLFRQLPELSMNSRRFDDKNPQMQSFEQWATKVLDREHRKANTFAQVIDLRNADADGIAYENKRRIIVAFSTKENPFDPGRTEVQAAILTYRIRNLGNHLAKFPRDLGNRLGLRKLVHHRAKILRYLRRKSNERYETVLEQLGLKRESVEGELIV
ncbi:mitochondrial ribosomal protein S15 [Lentinula edodes]|uniref:Mitochondrial ribosomal protein S15 n=1 Tax=Lentinula edodes TaxID=5353 RepID=A0A1Q3DYE8_LENED|nr:mitochondrial ribosomal protein S15 [Lentinula edodes]